MNSFLIWIYFSFCLSIIQTHYLKSAVEKIEILSGFTSQYLNVNTNNVHFIKDYITKFVIGVNSKNDNHTGQITILNDYVSGIDYKKFTLPDHILIFQLFGNTAM